LKFRLALGFFLIAAMCISLLQIIFAIIYVNKQTDKILYTYNINQKADYNVELYDNNFVDTTIMESGKVYISDLVKQINFKFVYAYSGTANNDFKYNYNIVGKLTGQSNTNETTETVWEKSYTLLEEVTETKKQTSGFAIDVPIKLDYSTYANEVTEFKKNFGMVLSTKLQIVMTINVLSNYNTKDISNTQKIIIYIPIGLQAFSITSDYKENTVEYIYDVGSRTKFYNDSNFRMGIIEFVISLIFFVYLFNLIFNIKCRNKYSKRLDQILKTYGSVIVEVVNPVKEEKYEIVEVKNFDEMIDLEEELRIPITFHEIIPTRYGIFTLLHNNTIYKYSLKNKDL
jgi:hypothetical protein